MKLLIFTFLVIISIVNASLPCKCRLGNLNRIVNGKIAKAHSIPWMVSLGTSMNQHFCTGSIFNQNYVLSAAHCTHGNEPSDILIRVGLHNTSELIKERIYNVKSIIAGPFKNPGDAGDFSLIELTKPIEFIPKEIEPACFDFEEKLYPGDILSAGWGLTSNPWKYVNDSTGQLHIKTFMSDVLKYYFSTQINNTECPPHDICLKAKNKGDTACIGDSGGPLMYTQNGKTSVIGIASYGHEKQKGFKIYECNGKLNYARLSSFKNLIDQHVTNYCEI